MSSARICSGSRVLSSMVVSSYAELMAGFIAGEVGAL
jgi:hypothetical protein